MDTNKPKKIKSKSLHRSETDKMLGGVAGGLGDYFNIDSTLIRLLFLFSLVFGGAGFFIYIILWIVIPSESSTKGLSEETIEENIEEIAMRAEKFGENNRIIWGLIFIFLGVGFLVSNFGLFNIFDLSKFFLPILFVVVGIIILFKNR